MTGGHLDATVQGVGDCPTHPVADVVAWDGEIGDQEHVADERCSHLGRLAGRVTHATWTTGGQCADADPRDR